ncbi:MAG: hypothetical protein ACD_37C00671G0018 [uncultured bacterium]|nr:MAG: hypothetical protein ACD_37C00671G0018 [uncultured bacterium]
MVFVFLFILGISIGSFLNVLIDRLPKNESINGRSHCDNCKKTLSWADLIPLLSFFLLKGKCKYCRSHLSYQYPLVEFLTGVLFVFTIYYLPITNLSTNYLISSIYYLTIVSSLVVVFFTDLKYGIILDKVTFPLVFTVFLWLLFQDITSLPEHLLSAVGSFIFFLLIFLLTRGKGMGLGDVKFSFVLGLTLGISGTILALYIAFLTGGIIGFILIIWKKKNLKTAVPFGPFLVVGFLISLFFSEQIAQYFLALI